MSIGKAYQEDGYTKQQFALHGGHRLWHGFSPENSQDNNWSKYQTRPVGGYLDDLWIYTKILDFSDPEAVQFRATNGKWKIRKPDPQCFASPGIAWETR